MKDMIMPSELSTEKELPLHLKNLIQQYNQTPENKPIERLYYLQKMNQFIRRATPNDAVIRWRNQIGASSLEAHLQQYHIHRDASALVQSIEFAQAVQRHQSPDAQPPNHTPLTDIYSEMRARDDLLISDNIDFGQYIQHNQAIADFYSKDEALQEKVQKSLYYLSLIYPKLESIQDVVQQTFPEYSTQVLGKSEGNNKNFTFHIDGENSPLVIRVEDRNDLGREVQLQTHDVSEYFSNDYATLMVPFKTGDETAYQPVVISEFAQQGDLQHYAETLQGKEPKAITTAAQKYFLQLCDFCLKLEASGHYHPDIKLSNFLVDGDTRV